MGAEAGVKFRNEVVILLAEHKSLSIGQICLKFRSPFVREDRRLQKWVIAVIESLEKQGFVETSPPGPITITTKVTHTPRTPG